MHSFDLFAQLQMIWRYILQPVVPLYMLINSNAIWIFSQHVGSTVDIIALCFLQQKLYFSRLYGLTDIEGLQQAIILGLDILSSMLSDLSRVCFINFLHLFINFLNGCTHLEESSLFFNLCAPVPLHLRLNKGKIFLVCYLLAYLNRNQNAWDSSWDECFFWMREDENNVVCILIWAQFFGFIFSGDPDWVCCQLNETPIILAFFFGEICIKNFNL